MKDTVLNINGQKALRFDAKIQKLYGSDKAVFVDFSDGEKPQIFPLSCIRDNKDGTIDIQEWIYKQKFPNG